MCTTSARLNAILLILVSTFHILCWNSQFCRIPDTLMGDDETNTFQRNLKNIAEHLKKMYPNAHENGLQKTIFWFTMSRLSCYLISIGSTVSARARSRSAPTRAATSSMSTRPVGGCFEVLEPRKAESASTQFFCYDRLGVLLGPDFQRAFRRLSTMKNCAPAGFR